MAAFVLVAAFAEFVDNKKAKFAEADTSVAEDSGPSGFDGAALTLVNAEKAVFAAAKG